MKRMIRANTYENSQEMGEAIINAWNAALHKCDYDEEDIHVLNYEEASKFTKALERELYNRHVDLTRKSLVLPEQGYGFQIEGMKVSGNVGGIASTLTRGVIKKAWEPLSKEYWEEYITDADEQGDEIYIEDKFGYCNPTTSQKALQLVSLGDKTQYSGHGSQSYIDDTKVQVYEDYFGNLKVARKTVRWD